MFGMSFGMRRRKLRRLRTCVRCRRYFRAADPAPLLCSFCQRLIRVAAGDDPYVDLGGGD
jgi:hypothetical protein